ncbi:MAG: TRAP transporter substrate-binding protein DctP [bacterium]|nr:MAG: TRAP transporter substrate-binding protein DctP [bacterium]
MRNGSKAGQRFIRLATVLVTVLAGVAGGGSGQWNTARAAGKPVKIRMATLAPKGSSFHQSLQRMGEKWRQAPEGGATLTIYTDGTMGSEFDVIRRMRIGQLQAAMLTVVGLADIEESVHALEYMPMMFRSLEEMEYVLESLRPTLESKMMDKGFVTLFWGDAGWIRWFTSQPVKYPEDLKTMKTFVWAGDTQQTELMLAAGYHPVPLEATDILTGLQTGMIDVVSTTPTYALAGQFYRQAKYMLEVNWAPLLGATVVTKKVWDNLSAGDREFMLEAAAEAGREIRAQSRLEAEQSVAAMKERGLVVQEVGPEVQASWEAAAREFYPKIRGAMVPAEVFDEVQQHIREYRGAERKGAQ